MGKIGEQLQADGLLDDRLLILFKKAQAQLLAIIERANPDSPFVRYRVSQMRAIEAVIRRLEERTKGWTDKEIPRLVYAGSREAEQMIRSFGESKFALAFSGVNEQVVRTLAFDAALEFGNTMIGLRRGTAKALMDKKKLADKIVEGVIQGSSVARTQNQLMDQLREQGITVLKSKNGFGRSFTLENYTNMLVRSQSMRAYNLGSKMQMLGSGRRFGKVIVLKPDIDGEDICNVFERKKYVDLKDPKNIPPWHPNCRHTVVPVSFEELQAERPDLYKLAVAEFRRASEA